MSFWGWCEVEVEAVWWHRADGLTQLFFVQVSDTARAAGLAHFYSHHMQ